MCLDCPWQYTITVSDEILKRSADAYRRIRNTARYFLSNTNDFNPETDMVANEDMLALDRWAMAKAAKSQAIIVEAYENMQFHLVYQGSNLTSICKNLSDAPS